MITRDTSLNSQKRMKKINSNIYKVCSRKNKLNKDIIPINIMKKTLRKLKNMSIIMTNTLKKRAIYEQK